MSGSMVCLRCRQILTPTAEGFQCPGCEGRFVRSAEIDARWLEDPPPWEQRWLINCLDCRTEMMLQMLGETKIDCCQRDTDRSSRGR